MNMTTTIKKVNHAMEILREAKLDVRRASQIIQRTDEELEQLQSYYDGLTSALAALLLVKDGYGSRNK